MSKNGTKLGLMLAVLALAVGFRPSDDVASGTVVGAFQPLSGVLLNERVHSALPRAEVGTDIGRYGVRPRSLVSLQMSVGDGDFFSAIDGQNDHCSVGGLSGGGSSFCSSNNQNPGTCSATGTNSDCSASGSTGNNFCSSDAGGLCSVSGEGTNMQCSSAVTEGTSANCSTTAAGGGCSVVTGGTGNNCTSYGSGMCSAFGGGACSTVEGSGASCTTIFGGGGSCSSSGSGLCSSFPASGVGPPQPPDPNGICD